jgi:hypothetical protein
MHKTSSQRYQEEWQAMPKWKRALGWLFFISVPFVASIESISF